MALETLGDVVSAAARVDHGTHHLDVDDVRELAGLLEVVEAAHLHHLTGDLVRHLPGGHVAIIYMNYRFLIKRSVNNIMTSQ